jgi:hypothetical protein
MKAVLLVDSEESARLSYSFIKFRPYLVRKWLVAKIDSKRDAEMRTEDRIAYTSNAHASVDVSSTFRIFSRQKQANSIFG